MATLIFAQPLYAQEPEGPWPDFWQNYPTPEGQAPFERDLETFAEFHDALLATLQEFENLNNYEDESPIEGVSKKTSSHSPRHLFQLLLSQAIAKSGGSICFFGGWPSRTSSSGLCQTPWTHSRDSELKNFGATYDRSHYCGGANLFRCNPLFFGPGKNGNGICVKFKKIAQVTSLCYSESRDQIDKIFSAYQNDELFKKRYLATVALMLKYCSTKKNHSPCQLLTLQVQSLSERVCGGNRNLEEMISSQPILDLIRDVQGIPPRAIVVPEPKPPRAIIVEEPARPRVASDRPIDQGLCNLYQTFKSKGVPSTPLLQALTYYHNNRSRFPNERYLSIADYSQNSSQKRFYLLDLTTGNVSAEKVSHGSGHRNGVKYGDRDHDGMIDSCRHSDNSRLNMTRPGFYKVSDFYESTRHRGDWPVLEKGTRNNGMRLVGLSSTNDDALGKGVVMHEAPYNVGGNATMGRSYGCPAFVPGQGAPLMRKMQGGSLLYAYVPNCPQEMRQVLADQKVRGWENSCR
jgi:hypothetical protein